MGIELNVFRTQLDALDGCIWTSHVVTLHVSRGGVEAHLNVSTGAVRRTRLGCMQLNGIILLGFTEAQLEVLSEN